MKSMLPLICEICEQRTDLISDGYDAALALCQKRHPLLTTWSIPTGTRVWDWVIPPKWTLHDWQVEMPPLSNTDAVALRVASYSLPFTGHVSGETLRQHFYYDPRRPHLIPWDYCFYERDWRLCGTQEEYNAINPKDQYYVHINSEDSAGDLKCGVVALAGERADEFILCAHLDHPFQANDNAASCVLLLRLCDWLASHPRRWSYRLILCPEMIGMVAYLSQHPEVVANTRGGICIDMVGRAGPLYMQHSRKPDTGPLDSIFAELVDRTLPYGAAVRNDERVLNSSGVSIPCIGLTRANPLGDPDGPFDAYHTSGDTPANLDEEALNDTLCGLQTGIERLEQDGYPHQVTPGPICLSNHGLWQDWRKGASLSYEQSRVIELLDGYRTISQIAAQTGLPFETIQTWCAKLESDGAIKIGGL